MPVTVFGIVISIIYFPSICISLSQDRPLLSNKKFPVPWQNSSTELAVSVMEVIS